MSDKTKFISSVTKKERKKLSDLKTSYLYKEQLDEITVLIEVLHGYTERLADTLPIKNRAHLHRYILRSLILGLQFYRDNRLGKEPKFNLIRYISWWVSASLESGEVTPRTVFKLSKIEE